MNNKFDTGERDVMVLKVPLQYMWMRSVDENTYAGYFHPGKKRSVVMQANTLPELDEKIAKGVEAMLGYMLDLELNRGRNGR